MQILPNVSKAIVATPRRNGTSAVECAVVLPLMLTIAIGCTDFARAIHVDIAVTNCARAGSDYAATNRFTSDTRSNWVEEITAIATEEASTIPDFDDSKFSVEVTDTPLGDRVLVSVTCNYRFERVVAWPGLPSNIELTHTVAMTQYQ